MKFAAVTCTGGRPELFGLCKRWVMRQTRRPDLWLVFSDIEGEQSPPDLPSWAMFIPVPKRDPAWFVGPGYLDPAWALTFALNNVPEGYAAIPMEDDDWYGANHCETLMDRIERGSLISYGSEVYYFHLPAQRWQLREGCDPTEGCVGIHPDAIGRYKDAMLAAIRGEVRWDPKDGVYPGFTKVDIKGVGYGLPGRSGTTTRHNPEHRKCQIMRPDPGWTKFRWAVGSDADAYLSLVTPFTKARA